MSDLGQGLNPMRITSIRSLPDFDTDDALQDTDDEIKQQLMRDHVVSPICEIASASWRPNDDVEFRSFLCVSRAA